jgi:hypothetical protein
MIVMTIGRMKEDATLEMLKDDTRVLDIPGHSNVIEVGKTALATDTAERAQPLETGMGPVQIATATILDEVPATDVRRIMITARITRVALNTVVAQVPAEVTTEELITTDEAQITVPGTMAVNMITATTRHHLNAVMGQTIHRRRKVVITKEQIDRPTTAVMMNGIAQEIRATTVLRVIEDGGIERVMRSRRGLAILKLKDAGATTRCSKDNIVVVDQRVIADLTNEFVKI